MKPVKINFFRFIFTVVLSFLIFGCSNRPSNVMSPSEMEDFLTEMYLMEGAMSLQGISVEPTDKRPVYYYQSLMKKHEINKALFDSSLVWYTRHPKQYKRIYIKVIQNLNQLKSKIQVGDFLPNTGITVRKNAMNYNLWNKDTHYKLSRDSAYQPIHFNIFDYSLMTNDQYRLRFRARISAPKTRLVTTIKIHYAGGFSDSLVALVPTDSVFRKYTLLINAKRNYQIDSITGNLLGYKGKRPGKLNVYIDSISLKRYFVSSEQDSLKQHLELPEALKLKNGNASGQRH